MKYCTCACSQFQYCTYAIICHRVLAHFYRDLSSHNLSVSEVVLPSVVSSGAGRGGSGAGSSGRARRQTDVMQEVHKRQK